MFETETKVSFSQQARMSRLGNFLSGNYILVLYLLFLPTMVNRVWQNPRGVIWSDAEGYYKYLPGIFIIGDMHKLPEGSVAPTFNDKGEILNKYTCGVAMFQAPFFLAARAYCLVTNRQPDDVFNIHYARSIAIAGYTIGFVGLFFLDRALRRWYAWKVRLLTILAVFLGTNLHFYMTKEMGMSHAYSFCLFAFILWHLPRYYQEPTVARAALLGGALGWCILIRPTNVVALILVFLYDLYAREDLQDRLRFFWKHRLQLLMAAAVAFCFFVPQLWYWYEMTGSPVRYSYANESFIYWKKPKVLEVLFDVQNGLLTYSPIVVFMLLGMFVHSKTTKVQTPALLLTFLISTYLFASWWAWWFGGAFGHRCYVELYAFFALPLAGLIDRVFQSGRVVQALFFPLFAFLVYYGLKLSYLYTELGGPWDGPDWRWNPEKLYWIWEHLF